jgi:plastocyanin domain-containing protein
VAGRSVARYVDRMIRMSVVLAVAVFACRGDAKAPPAAPAVAPVTAGTVGADGIRRVAIEANIKGYQPDRIAGKPGEPLVLVFTRTVDAACLAQVKTPDGKRVDLPKGTPVEVAVTVPTTGEIGFACGMDMFHGTIVATTSS